jgi:hypothetical protein
MGAGRKVAFSEATFSLGFFFRLGCEFGVIPKKCCAGNRTTAIADCNF